MFVELQTIKLLIPELILVIMAAWIFLVGRSRSWWAAFAVLSYAIAGFALGRHIVVQWELLEAGLSYSSGPLSVDLLAYVFRALAIVTGILFTLVAWHGEDKLSGEYLGSLMLAVAGVMLVSFANELIFLFLALELLSIPTYVLLYLGGSERSNAEATAKYFFLSILSSAMLLYGLSFLYGLAGTTTLDGIRLALEGSAAIEGSGDPLARLAPIMLVLVVAGLGFRITAVPFHFYAPDVYQGTTNANAGLLAVLPKIAGFVALVRVLVEALPASIQLTWQLAVVLAILTMTVGNVCALWQNNLRRLMAYSSIAHSGYMLIGLSVGLAATDQQVGYGGIASTLFYLLVYAVASLAVFAVLAYLSSRRRQCSTIDELNGLGWSSPWAAGALAVAMFSLAGIPPLAGFWGKLTLLTSAIGLAMSSSNGALAWWFTVLAVIGVINAAVAAAYYLRVVAAMYFSGTVERVRGAKNWGPATAAAFCTAVVLVLGVMPGPAVQLTEQIELSVRRRIDGAQEPTMIGWNRTRQGAEQEAVR